jgi:hypothetical protein
MSIGIQQRERKLATFFERAGRVDDPELQSELSKLAAVLVCGYIERSVETIFLDYAEKRSPDPIKNFLRGHFKRGTNYDCAAIQNLLDRFSPAWGENFRRSLSDNAEIEERIKSIYTVRNSVAHGGNQNNSLRNIKTAYDTARSLISIIQSSMVNQR